MCFKRFFAVVCLVALVITTPICAEEKPQESDYYKITSFETPEGEVIEACGFQMMDDGRVAVCSRRGDIFTIANPYAENVTADQFKLFARGLHEPLSLALRDGWLYAVQRPEVTRMKDNDSDGVADVFETAADGWGISSDYHEYAFGSKFDKDGNLYITLCLTGSFGSSVPYRGWAMKITPDGQTIPFCSGVRSPGGMGMNLDGDVFYTDNQGPWNGTCGLKWVRPGGFVGHPGGWDWFKLCEEVMGKPPTKPQSGSRIHLESKKIPELVPTAIMFPYDKMGKSASGIACDTSKGKFGPFTGQLFVADQSHSTLMRVDLEKVDGVYQGACFPFRSGFASGNVGVEMSPRGSIFVGGTNRGWGSRGSKPFAIERLDWTGKIPFEMQTMRLTKDGFELTFTEPATKESAEQLDSYQLTTYTYEYREQYGSPEVDHTTPTIKNATLSEDGMRVSLKVEGLQEGHVHELHANGVRNKKSYSLLHSEAYYTLNRLR